MLCSPRRLASRYRVSAIRAVRDGRLPTIAMPHACDHAARAGAIAFVSRGVNAAVSQRRRRSTPPTRTSEEWLPRLRSPGARPARNLIESNRRAEAALDDAYGDDGLARQDHNVGCGGPSGARGTSHSGPQPKLDSVIGITTVTPLRQLTLNTRPAAVSCGHLDTISLTRGRGSSGRRRCP